MKRIILSLTLFLFVFSNYLDACVVGNPPTSVCDFRQYDTSFDWKPPTFEYYKAGSSSNPITIQSPFYSGQQSANSNIYFLSATPEKDYEFDDGWRYVTHDFGEPTRKINHPYFVLYQIRSGMLRVFVAVDQLEGQNTEAMVTLDWLSGTKSAILDHYNGKDYVHAVDNFDPDAKARVPNFFTNNVNPPYWLHADFNMNYDPCTCLYSSTLRIRANLIAQSSLSFEIDGTLLQEIDNNGRAGSAGGFAGLTNSAKGFTAAFKDGSSGYTTFQKVLKPDPTTGAGGGISSLAEFVSLLTGTGKIIGGILKFVNLFTGSTAAPSAATTPMVFKADLDGSGTMMQESPYKTINMETPGSEITVVESFLPGYDNVMGVFNLLKTPKIKREIHFDPDGVDPERPVGHRFILEEPIQYVANPRAAINMAASNTMIKVGYDYVTLSGQKVSTDAYDISCFSDFILAINGNSSHNNPDPNQFYVKIIAVFGDYTGNSMPIVARYKVDLTSQNIYSWVDHVTGSVPSNSCSGYYYPASPGQISAVCNGSRYTNKSGNLKEDKSDTRSSDNDEGEEIEERADNLTNSDKLIIYPNPSAHSVTVRYGLAEQGRISIKLMNLQGQLLKVVVNEENHYPGTYEVGLGLDDISNGAYILVRETADGISQGKIMVQK